MKRTAPIILAAALAVSVMAAPSLARTARHRATTRTATATYYGGGGAFGLNGKDDPVGGAGFKTYAGEKYVTIKVTDQSGKPVAASWGQKTDNTPGGDNKFGSFCTTASRIPIAPGADLHVYVGEGPCSDGTMGAATTGTIKVTFIKP